MLVKEARKITDSLTRTSKMPGLSYSLPAWACQTGAKLRKITRPAPCFGCYAMKNNYTRYPAIKAAQYRRLDAITRWSYGSEAMVAQILSAKNGLDGMTPATFNQKSIWQKIIEVCKLTPDTKHWLPTQERQYLPAPEDVPDNLIIRLSADRRLTATSRQRLVP